MLTLTLWNPFPPNEFMRVAGGLPKLDQWSSLWISTLLSWTLLIPPGNIIGEDKNPWGMLDELIDFVSPGDELLSARDVIDPLSDIPFPLQLPVEEPKPSSEESAFGPFASPAIPLRKFGSPLVTAWMAERSCCWFWREAGLEEFGERLPPLFGLSCPPFCCICCVARRSVRAVWWAFLRAFELLLKLLGKWPFWNWPRSPCCWSPWGRFPFWASWICCRMMLWRFWATETISFYS